MRRQWVICLLLAGITLAICWPVPGGFQDAVQPYLETLHLKLDFPDTLNHLPRLLATGPDALIRDGAQAVMVGTLVATNAKGGWFDDAITMAGKAFILAAKSGEQNLLHKSRELPDGHRQHRPARE